MIEEEGVRLAGMGDIAAMKLSAIAQNVTRLKDFIDVAYMSTVMSLSDMIKCYDRKFPDANPAIPMKAVSYFADINFNESICLTDADYSWKGIEKRILDMQRSPDEVFPSAPL